MRFAIAAVLLVLASMPALAHSWYSKKVDPVWRNGCCGGNDCAQLVVTPENVTAEADGYRIRLTHEEAKKINPYTTSGIDALVIWERVQPSEDGNWHICIMTSYRDKARGGIYCLFAPPNG
jgi:hypothetical protein